ncbi:RNA methyltransferase [Polaromonas sp.]|nr:RNA methyltransferase [Candidatus Saccharibacteria bacterium]
MSTDDHLDPSLLDHKDTRNVRDAYKHWTVAAIKEDLTHTAFPLHVAIENFQHDYNIGTIVRSANAFNVAGVHIIGKRHWNRRGAMATEKYLELFHHPTVADFNIWVQEQQLQIIGIDNIPGSRALSTAPLPAKAIYVFGQEGPGLSAELQALCREIIAIEQFGSTRSINLGVAAGIILYEWVRQNGQICDNTP